MVIPTQHSRLKNKAWSRLRIIFVDVRDSNFPTVTISNICLAAPLKIEISNGGKNVDNDVVDPKNFFLKNSQCFLL